MYFKQGMTNRRSFDRDWRSFFRDREVIADLFLKKNDRKVIAIAIIEDCAIFSLNKTENNTVQNHEKLLNIGNLDWVKKLAFLRKIYI